MNLSGLILGLFTFLAIGLGFLWVVKLEYHVGAGVWRGVALLGCAIVVLSAFVSDPMGSAAVGILGGTVVWGAFELPDQERRVAAGMFKKNPRRERTGGGP